MISIAIPVYGSSETLAPLYERLRAVLDERGEPYEVVFVDDGSPDRSWEILLELREQDPEIVTAIQLMRNFGQHNALMCAFRHAKGDCIVTLDDDLQNPPEEIPKLLEALEQGKCDLVYGVPRRKQHARGRNLGSRIVNAFFRLVFRTGVTVTSFRAIRRELLSSILTYNLNFTFIDGLLAWNTQRVGEATVQHNARSAGRSRYSLAKLATLALNLFTNFSLLPLQIASAVGLCAAAAGLLFGCYYLLQALLSNIAVPGYASIIVAVMVLGGLQLLALGIIGEYIGRLHLNVNRKPQYTVRRVLEHSDGHSPPPERRTGHLHEAVRF
jgi:undecaprenyl-phosphate 4-deoxy-4-formamido-L-arabinose transferase